ncbi:hypothetical protein CBR_g52066 [Chara braunii]|uniref:MYND-type domain-containing protein n=1 Tax=Chara braunii TaxID=69332 RepID=A0A388M9C7_CHABU|nr:hypothetical protein CBR_g52066 [Chara braunii]|eukprot:GBG91184.1 hypothetical protein CBR_g52066 [Chara braunii]
MADGSDISSASWLRCNESIGRDSSATQSHTESMGMVLSEGERSLVTSLYRKYRCPSSCGDGCSSTKGYTGAAMESRIVKRDPDQDDLQREEGQQSADGTADGTGGGRGDRCPSTYSRKHAAEEFVMYGCQEDGQLKDAPDSANSDQHLMKGMEKAQRVKNGGDEVSKDGVAVGPTNNGRNRAADLEKDPKDDITDLRDIRSGAKVDPPIDVDVEGACGCVLHSSSNVHATWRDKQSTLRVCDANSDFRKAPELSMPVANCKQPTGRSRKSDASSNWPTEECDITVRICGACNGSGRCFERYYYRQLEAECSHCHGEGVVRRSLRPRPTKANQSNYDANQENEAANQGSKPCVCFSCSKVGAQDDMFCCSDCKMTVYCGKECQKKDWANHKQVCMTPVPSIHVTSETIAKPLVLLRTIHDYNDGDEDGDDDADDDGDNDEDDNDDDDDGDDDGDDDELKGGMSVSQMLA